MRLNEDLAEVVGAFIGDGCMSGYCDREGRNRCVVMFTGHWKNDGDYYRNKISAVILREFDYDRKLYHRKDDNTIRYVLVAKRVVAFFKELGLPTGEKGDRTGIPEEILKNERLALACVRGIFNTDGSLYRRYSKKYNGHPKAYRRYAVVQFKMKNHKVIRQLKGILERYEIKVNRITKVLNCSIIRVTEQASVRKFVAVIGFTHPYHEKRYYDIINETPSAENLDYNFKDMPSKKDTRLGL